MKYFSPSVLDGSITTAKLADLAVTSDKLASDAVTSPKILNAAVTNPKIGGGAVRQGQFFTSTTSQSGTIVGNGQVLVTMSAYTFFPDIEAAAVLDSQPLLADNVVTPAAAADTPQFRIENSVGVGRLYDVEWRHVSA